MATFVAMFYSQRSRKKLLNASKRWRTESLFNWLKLILDKKYLKTASRESEDYRKFSDNTFGKILTYLHKEDSNAFPYDPRIVEGFNPEYYIGKLYKLLDVDYRMFEYSSMDKRLYYSYLNEEFDNIKYSIVGKVIHKAYFPNDIKYSDIEANIHPPQILIVVIRKDNWNTPFFKKYFPNVMINEGDTKENLTSMSDKIYFHGSEYNLDSVILSNWNKMKLGHAIAGITCKKKRYVYNGWTRTSMDPAMANKIITRKIPCELMKYNWNIRKDNDFCLNTKKCIPDILKQKELYKRVFGNDDDKKELCFDFSVGYRLLIYVRKDAAVDTSVEIDDSMSIHPKNTTKASKAAKAVVKKSPKKCPDGKVLNPETGRCILIKNAAKAVVKKSPKKCPDGKVLNPETGRCILIKNAAKATKKSPKKCPDGKVLNPATGRCILIKNAVKAAKAVIKKSPKKCPDGKVLNPATGRCILIKNLKK